MNISLPESLKAFVDEQVQVGSYGTSSEYVRELIRADMAQKRLKHLLMEGASANALVQVSPALFDGLRASLWAKP